MSNPRIYMVILGGVALSAMLVAGCGSEADDRRAALGAAGEYAVQAWNDCGVADDGGLPADNGSSDDKGNLYLTCGETGLIQVFDPAGKPTRRIQTNLILSDVAPSPSGDFLYVATGTGPPRRLNRQASGDYTLDGGWQAAKYSFDGSQISPSGHFIATDDAGSVYLANGTESAYL